MRHLLRFSAVLALILLTIGLSPAFAKKKAARAWYGGDPMNKASNCSIDCDGDGWTDSEVGGGDARSCCMACLYTCAVAACEAQSSDEYAFCEIAT